MPSKKSAKYAKDYSRYREDYEKAYFAQSYKLFLVSARNAINSFLYSFIYYSFDDDQYVVDIFRKKIEFHSIVFDKKKPSFDELLALAYASPKHSIIDTVPKEILESLNTSLDSNQIDPQRIFDIRSQLSRISRLFDSFSFDSGDLDKKLTKALKECKKISEDGFKNANRLLN